MLAAHNVEQMEAQYRVDAKMAITPSDHHLRTAALLNIRWGDYTAFACALPLRSVGADTARDQADRRRRFEGERHATAARCLPPKRS